LQNIKQGGISGFMEKLILRLHSACNKIKRFFGGLFRKKVIQSRETEIYVGRKYYKLPTEMVEGY
jgi:hypothetical protein